MDCDPLLALTLCEAAYALPATHQAGDCFVRITPFDGLKWVAFRGTNPGYMPDDLSDLDALPTLYPPLGLCHTGFMRNVIGIQDQLKEAIGDDPWASVGHSKGGSEAIGFACWMTEAVKRPPKTLITYGAARMGFEVLNAIRTRIPGIDNRNCCDPVPEVPIGFLRNASFLQIGPPALTLRPIDCHMLGAYRSTLALGTA